MHRSSELSMADCLRTPRSLVGLQYRTVREHCQHQSPERVIPSPLWSSVPNLVKGQSQENSETGDGKGLREGLGLVGLVPAGNLSLLPLLERVGGSDPAVQMKRTEMRFCSHLFFQCLSDKHIYEIYDNICFMALICISFRLKMKEERERGREEMRGEGEIRKGKQRQKKRKRFEEKIFFLHFSGVIHLNFCVFSPLAVTGILPSFGTPISWPFNCVCVKFPRSLVAPGTVLLQHQSPASHSRGSGNWWLNE